MWNRSQMVTAKSNRNHMDFPSNNINTASFLIMFVLALSFVCMISFVVVFVGISAALAATLVATLVATLAATLCGDPCGKYVYVSSPNRP